MPELPRGTVTFLFTDIEGSTALWEHDPAGIRAAVARHFEQALVEARTVADRIAGNQDAVMEAPSALIAPVGGT